jgi:hypothetical protein
MELSRAREWQELGSPGGQKFRNVKLILLQQLSINHANKSSRQGARATHMKPVTTRGLKVKLSKLKESPGIRLAERRFDCLFS